jgi:hypothetical protein
MGFLQLRQQKLPEISRRLLRPALLLQGAYREKQDQQQHPVLHVILSFRVGGSVIRPHRIPSLEHPVYPSFA